jgi:hypothetical protein
VVKTQWLDAWIRDPAALRKPTPITPREIDQIQAYLKAVSHLCLRVNAVKFMTSQFEMEMPTWVARLPNKVGLPAGGNLTSDEWKGMLLVLCPLIVCLVLSMNYSDYLLAPTYLGRVVPYCSRGPRKSENILEEKRESAS